jgi:hypothetical protein
MTELRTILQRESQNSKVYKQTKSVNSRKTVKTVMTLTCIICERLIMHIGTKYPVGDVIC